MLTPIWALENDTKLYSRFFFDNIFNLLVIQILLNIVSGIIIDEFGELKDKLQDRKEDMNSQCFICGIEREKLDRMVNGFNHHYKKEHNMWDYVFYTAYLRVKPETEYTGTESYISEKIKNSDISWFPVRR